MVDVLFLSLKIIAEEVTPAHHENVPFLHEELHCVLKLQVEQLVVGNQVETTELVSTQQKDLPTGQTPQR